MKPKTKTKTKQLLESFVDGSPGEYKRFGRDSFLYVLRIFNVTDRNMNSYRVVDKNGSRYVGVLIKQAGGINDPYLQMCTNKQKNKSFYLLYSFEHILFRICLSLNIVCCTYKHSTSDFFNSCVN